MPLASDIAEYLEDQTLGTVGTDMFFGYMPPTPNACIVTIAEGGRPRDQVQIDIERGMLRIDVRDVEYVDAEATIYAISTTLHELTNATIEGVKYYYISSQQSAPTNAGRDNNGRVILSWRFEVTKEVE